MSLSTNDVYTQLQDALLHLKSPTTTEEAHGLLTATILTHGDEETWLPQLATHLDEHDQMVLESVKTIRITALETLRLLNDEELSFAPLVPDDHQPLPDRIEGLRLWCQGFLAGLGLSEQMKPLLENGDFQETLQDFEAISQMGLETPPSEQDEMFYMEVYEYVRIAVLFLQECFSELETSTNTVLADDHEIG